MTSATGRRKRAFLVTLAVVSWVLALAGGVGVVWWWGVGFDEAEALGVAMRSTNAAMVASFWTAVAGAVGLVVTSSCAMYGRKRS